MRFPDWLPRQIFSWFWPLWILTLVWRAWGQSSCRPGCGRAASARDPWRRRRRKWWSQIPGSAKNTAKYKHPEDLFLPLFLSSKTEIECKLNILWRIIIQSSQHWVNQNTKYVSFLKIHRNIFNQFLHDLNQHYLWGDRVWKEGAGSIWQEGTTGLLEEDEDEACCSDLRDHQPGV